MPFPFAAKRFIPEAPDSLQPIWAANRYDIFPFFIPFQNIKWQSIELFYCYLMLEDFPHTNIIIYVIWYVNLAALWALI